MTLAASEARALGDIMSESMGGIISECPGDFIGIGTLLPWPTQSLAKQRCAVPSSLSSIRIVASMTIR